MRERERERVHFANKTQGSGQFKNKIWSTTAATQPRFTQVTKFNFMPNWKAQFRVKKFYIVP